MTSQESNLRLVSCVQVELGKYNQGRTMCIKSKFLEEEENHF